MHQIKNLTKENIEIQRVAETNTFVRRRNIYFCITDFNSGLLIYDEPRYQN